ITLHRINGFYFKSKRSLIFCLSTVNIIIFTYIRDEFKTAIMVKILTYFIVIFLLIGCKNEEKPVSETLNTSENEIKKEENFGIVLHGGAGTILKEKMSDSLEAAYKAKPKQAISIGYEILKNGGTSLEAVTNTT